MNDHQPIAPEYTSLSAAIEAKETSAVGNRAADTLRAAARNGQVVRNTDPNAPRSFVSPTFPNSKFLVKAGVLQTAPYQQAALGMIPAISRTGDVWVRFVASVCTTNDPLIISWLEAHSGNPEMHLAYHEQNGGVDARSCGTPIGLCREQGPGIDDWFKIKQAQMDFAHRNHGLDPSIDIDALLDGTHPAQRNVSTEIQDGISRSIQADQNAYAERAHGLRN